MLILDLESTPCSPWLRHSGPEFLNFGHQKSFFSPDFPFLNFPFLNFKLTARSPSGALRIDTLPEEEKLLLQLRVEGPDSWHEGPDVGIV